MAKSPNPRHNGALLPNLDYGLAYRWFMSLGYPRIREIIEQDLGSALIYINSHAKDFAAPELEPYLKNICAVPTVWMPWNGSSS